MNKAIIDNLIKIADEAKNNAYCPYSRFPVGAALLTKKKGVFTGVNVENASYGLSICAERVAVGKAVSDGVTDFIALAVVADKNGILPCGACLQVLSEFSGNLEIIYKIKNGKITITKLKDLIPKRFKLN
ncbi:MAG: cytidine deaminase [bacterium]